MKRLLMTLLAAIAAFVVSAADIVWTGASGDGLWASKRNWSGNAIPTASDTAVFSIPGRTDVFVDISNKSIGGFKVTQGELFVDGDFYVQLPVRYNGGVRRKRSFACQFQQLV